MASPEAASRIREGFKEVHSRYPTPDELKQQLMSLGPWGCYGHRDSPRPGEIYEPNPNGTPGCIYKMTDHPDFFVRDRKGNETSFVSTFYGQILDTCHPPRVEDEKVFTVTFDWKGKAKDDDPKATAGSKLGVTATRGGPAGSPIKDVPPKECK
jgi:hypothetical protein